MRPSARRRALARLAGLSGLAALGPLASACGFHLRRSATLPFHTLYTNFAPTSAIGAEFRRLVRVAKNTQLVDDPTKAEARLEVVTEQRERQIVVFSSTGRAREYQLRLRFVFRVVGANSQVLLPPTELLLSRDITATDVEIVAKQQEEELLYREMESELVQQLLRRLAAIQMPSAPSAPPNPSTLPSPPSPPNSPGPSPASAGSPSS